MVCPILISVSVTPGAFSAKAGRAARAAAVAALACKNVRRENILLSPCLLLTRAVVRVAFPSLYFIGAAADLDGFRNRRSTLRVKNRPTPTAPDGAAYMITISKIP